VAFSLGKQVPKEKISGDSACARREEREVSYFLLFSQSESRALWRGIRCEAATREVGVALTTAVLVFGAAAKHGHRRQSVGACFPAFGGARRRPRAPHGHVGGAHAPRSPGGGRRVPAGGRSGAGRLQILREARRRSRLQDEKGESHSLFFFLFLATTASQTTRRRHSAAELLFLVPLLLVLSKCGRWCGAKSLSYQLWPSVLSNLHPPLNANPLAVRLMLVFSLCW